MLSEWVLKWALWIDGVIAKLGSVWDPFPLLFTTFLPNTVNSQLKRLSKKTKESVRSGKCETPHRKGWHLKEEAEWQTEWPTLEACVQNFREWQVLSCFLVHLKPRSTNKVDHNCKNEQRQVLNSSVIVPKLSLWGIADAPVCSESQEWQILTSPPCIMARFPVGCQGAKSSKNQHYGRVHAKLIVVGFSVLMGFVPAFGTCFRFGWEEGVLTVFMS